MHVPGRVPEIDDLALDAGGVDLSDGPCQSMFANTRGKLFAAVGNQFLGIVKAHDTTPGIEDDGRGDDRTEESASTRFIEAGDSRPAKFAGRAFETRATHASHDGLADSSTQTSGVARRKGCKVWSARKLYEIDFSPAAIR